MRKLLILFPLMLLLLLSVAFACKCRKPGSPNEEKEKASHVYTGIVSEIKSTEQGFEVTFTSKRIFKGETTKSITIFTGNHDCGWKFQKGETYIVYATQESGAKIPETNICTRTKLLSEASEDLKELGKGKKPKKC